MAKLISPPELHEIMAWGLNQGISLGNFKYVVLLCLFHRIIKLYPKEGPDYLTTLTAGQVELVGDKVDLLP